MIVFPMAGESRRFTEAGYPKPKYMLELGGGYCFDYAIAGFLEPYRGELFAFVHRDEKLASEFVTQRLNALNVRDYRLVPLQRQTGGQAETVVAGLESLNPDGKEPLSIFNIDTFRRNLTPPAGGDGRLEVFVGSGANWSYVLPETPGSGMAAKVAEKDPISDLCCTGLYSFARCEDFLWAYEQEKITPSNVLNESYVAPLYNHLIRRGAVIGYDVVDPADIAFCGVPAEYEALRMDHSKLAAFAAK